MGKDELILTRLVEGWRAIERGDPRSAERIAADVLRENSQRSGSSRLVAEVENLLGVALAQQGKHREAISALESAVKRDPQSAGSYNNLGSVLMQVGRSADAVPVFEKAIALQPDFAQAHNNLGSAHRALGRRETAVECYRKALQLAPDDFQTHAVLGDVLTDAGRYEEAIASLRAALALNPHYVPAHNSLGVAFGCLGRDAEAIESFQRVLALEPGYAEAHTNLGLAYQRQKRFDEAISCHQKAVAIEPGHAQAYVNLGSVYLETGRLEEAAACYRQALSASSTFAMAHTLLGAVYRRQKRMEEALECHQRALAIDPDLAEAHANLGVVYQALRRLDEALACYQRAIALRPGMAEAHTNLGTVYQELRRFPEAIACHEAALTLAPRSADALHNLGAVLQDLGRHPEAIACFEKALMLQPDHEHSLSALAWSELGTCAWGSIDARIAALRHSVREGGAIIDPFTFLAVSEDPGEQRRCAERYVEDRVASGALRPGPGTRSRHQKIRLAYLSSDFRAHPMTYVITGLIESHDRSRFEVVGISYGPDDGSDARTRLAKGFDRFIDVRAKDDGDVAQVLRALETDIAIDLNGHTKQSRPGILASRPAPIQVSYLGYPGTMGADFIDYILADAVVVPDEHERFYSEKIVRLPDSYWVNDSKRKAMGRAPARPDAGLPPSGFVFCCFNNNYKIMPRIFDVWMRLLSGVPGSVLWLLEDNAFAKENLRSEARRRGIAPGRLVFAPRVPQEEHLARHRLVDLFLDTLPYNAHTTASDALWAGVPVLTCAGATFAGRVAGSLLRAAGLPELITPNLEEYEALALKLATGPDRLEDIRRKLERTRVAAPLFDTDRFRRGLEAAYATMWEMWQRGENPKPFTVAADS